MLRWSRTTENCFAIEHIVVQKNNPIRWHVSLSMPGSTRLLCASVFLTDVYVTSSFEHFQSIKLRGQSMMINNRRQRLNVCFDRMSLAPVEKQDFR